MDMAQRHSRVSKSVVVIRITEPRKAPVTRDGVVVAHKAHRTVIIADEESIIGPKKVIRVIFPNQAEVQVSRILSGSGITVLECRHLDQQHGLEEVEVFDGELQELQEVHTYSHHQRDRVLTPGNISSLFAGGFNHTCLAHEISSYGSPVFNNDAQLVGICFGFAEHLSAHSITAIARKIQDYYDRDYTSISDTFQYLRQ